MKQNKLFKKYTFTVFQMYVLYIFNSYNKPDLWR